MTPPQIRNDYTARNNFKKSKYVAFMTKLKLKTNSDILKRVLRFHNI